MPTATPIATTTPGSWLPKAVLEIGDATFVVEIANTPQSRARGLGFRDSLPEGRGMWFEYETPRLASFWMRGMRFPLDMVWIDANLRVVGVTADVPHAPPGTPDSDLPTYSSPSPVRYVLELNAGTAAQHGIVPGSQVRFVER